ncbi:hypothetical protein COU59_01085, partial [Candidatus Pacearchaeota archaeon CG10_big_fil_rev_8_21_14_0_10_34_12]
MKNKKISLMFLIFGIYILSLNLISSVGENTYCAERTIEGAWCQNVPLDKVNQDYRYAPTSCESTSYCKLGTCVDSQEGLCMENSPQKVCENPNNDGSGGGVWFDAEVDEVPQCKLGCCLLGDEASFVTQTRCKQLSSLYGLETNYRTDIQSEVQCIATATSKAKGACVFEKEFETTCKFTTKEECNSLASSDLGNGNSTIGFHEDYLCSAESLLTNCGPSQKTAIVEGKDEVYFVDTCGNIANIYDSQRQNDKSYWEKVVLKSDSCGITNSNGNAGSSTCGNCDYFLGSTGKKYDRTIDPTQPKFGDYICRDLGCEYQGQEYKHGETWCASSTEQSKNLPGDRYFRQVCYNGEVSIEPCADFRQEVCIQDEVNGFSTAACRVNMWQECTSQSSEKDCTNADKRDCTWLSNKCVPKYTPGFDFWASSSTSASSDAESLCSLANNNCIVKYEKGLIGDWECSEN